MPVTERRRRWELESMLETVLVDGMVIASRFRIPTLLGRARERGEIWQELLDIYADLGGDPTQLRGKKIGDKILITRFDMDINPYDSASFEEIRPSTIG
jgi:hypothetical protein